MPRYFTLWEMDQSKMPADPKERLALLKKMSDMTKKFLKEHPGAEWGGFVGEGKGFAISSSSGTALEMNVVSQMFAPYVQNKVYQAISIEEFDDVIKALAQQK
jgi:hypothetical protein